MQMHGEGKSLTEIRTRIEEAYRPKYKFITPTPHPPRAPGTP